jgi:long-subunit acyl-CoA synthetase (AMP-forming)
VIEICLVLKKMVNGNMYLGTETSDLILNLASGLNEIGVKKNDKISIIADNSYKWCVIDLAIISLGVQ